MQRHQQTNNLKNLKRQKKMDKPQKDKTKWKEVISQPDSITTKKAKSDPDAPVLNKTNYEKPAKKNR